LNCDKKWAGNNKKIYNKSGFFCIKKSRESHFPLDSEMKVNPLKMLSIFFLNNKK
jgi:hypothetical protein